VHADGVREEGVSGNRHDALDRNHPDAARRYGCPYRETFEAYNAALAQREFGGACARPAPETTAKLRENVVEAGLKDAPEDCSGLPDAIYTATDQDPPQKKTLDEVVKTARIDSIRITGDKAVINWSATVQGNKTAIAQSARRVDGEWKLIDVTN
jgi:hypothetical protein